jgi:spermidine/putrescine transport system permease protein
VRSKINTNNKNRINIKFIFMVIYSTLIYLFLYIPLVIVVLYSFSSSNSIISFGSFTLKWYLELFKDKNLLLALLHSLEITISAVFISNILGVSGAFFVNRVKFPGKTLFKILVQLPYILPGIIVGIALLVFFINLKISLSMFTILIGHIAFTTPVIMVQVSSRIEKLGTTYEDAAKDLGANPMKVFFLVILPMIKTAIIGGSLLAFAISFDEIIITYFLTGTWSTLPVYMYGMMRFGLSPQVYAISTFILILSLIFIILMTKVTGTKSEVVIR